MIETPRFLPHLIDSAPLCSVSYRCLEKTPRFYQLVLITALLTLTPHLHLRRPVGRPSTTGRREERKEKTITNRDTKADFIHLATPEVNLFEGEIHTPPPPTPPLYFRIASELIHNGFADPRVLGGPVGANRELNEAKVGREETEMSPWRSRRQN